MVWAIYWEGDITLGEKKIQGLRTYHGQFLGLYYDGE